VDALRQIEGWPAEHVAAGVVTADGSFDVAGEAGRSFALASVTKPFAAYAVLVAVEEGTVDLDDAAGPPGSTVRHLLAHASGLPLDDPTPVAPPGERRIYSNVAFEHLGELLADRAGLPFADYLAEAVLSPLGLSAELAGSPAWGLRATLDDVLRFARELLRPTLLARETVDEATRVAFPGLAGVLPGYGRMEPNDWGLGFELRDGKEPHWTGTLASPATFGHFGRSGTFLWVDPEAGLALASLADLEFGDWAREAWPRLSDGVLAEHRD
jgi:CubicO group peptidase (beta-lactamase class C family)